MDRRTIFLKAPPAPLCFATRDTWVTYLDSAQSAGKVKPFDKSGNYRPKFGFCSDCPAKHAHEMHAKGRCAPIQYQQNLLLTVAPAKQGQGITTPNAEPEASTT